MSQEATSTVMMIVVMVALFYFMLYRPQKKQAAKRKALLDSLTVGTDVVTIGGIYGKIVALDDKTVQLQVADGIVMTFARAAINGKVTVDVQEGGAVYNFTGPQGFGIANMADSLWAIKKLVFEEGKYTLAFIKEALENN